MKHQLNVLSPRGDAVMAWDTEDEASVEEARGQFQHLRANGHMAFKDTKEGSEVVVKFDPDVDMTVVPQLVGG